jgi:hypothetical protein
VQPAAPQSRAATSSYSFNNDTIVTPGWLDALVRSLRPPSRIAGLVGAKLIYPDGRLQEAGGIVWRDGSRGTSAATTIRRPEYNYLREADYCSGACLAVPRALFRARRFRPRYAPAYYEDPISRSPCAPRPQGLLSSRLRRSCISRARRRAPTRQRRQAASGDQPGCVRGEMGGRARARTVPTDRRGAREGPARQRRVLVIDACMLTPDQDSGSLRMQAILEILCALRCKVTFVADNLEYGSRTVGELQRPRRRGAVLAYVDSIGAARCARRRVRRRS